MIITSRIIAFIAAAIISRPGVGPYYVVQPCDQILALNSNRTATLRRYPICTDITAHAAVQATLDAAGPEEAGAVLGFCFELGFWLALAIHAIGIEVYLRLTPAESERLRRISYERQLRRGWKHAGSAGLTIDRYGDSEPWPVPDKE